MASYEQAKKIDPITPVYHAKFADILSRIREILKPYQHGIQIVQNERNGVTASVEITITLTK